jgi:hypothetical protein
MKHMSKSHRRNIFDLLFEESEQDQKEAEGLEEAELSLELEDTEVEDLAAAEDADAVDAALEDILAGIELEVGVGEELEDEDAGEAVEVGEEEVEVEEEVVEEADMEEMDMSETMYEIDESVLRRELRRMRRLREQEEGRGMKRQLVEMNLFNAKLLYANKLMQNKNLTMKQQKSNC